MAWKVVKNVHAAEYDNDGIEDEEERTVCENAERIATAAFWVPSAEKFYVVVRREYFLECMTWRPGSVLDCFVACCRSDERKSEMLIGMGV